MTFKTIFKRLCFTMLKENLLLLNDLFFVEHVTIRIHMTSLHLVRKEKYQECCLNSKL